MSFNIRSYFKNIDQFLITAGNLIGKIDIIVMTEMWTNFDTVSLCNIPGYDSFHNYRNAKIGGGIGIFVKNNLQCRKLQIEVVNDDIECLGVQVYSEESKKWSSFLGVYRPPAGPIKNFISQLNDIVSRSKITENDCVITGDFNICLMKEEDHKETAEFIDMMHSFHFLPLITKPTRVTERGASLIDHMWSNILSDSQSGVLDVTITDHFPIFTIFKSYTDKANRKIEVKFRSLTKENINRFKMEISKTNWDVVLGDSNDSNINVNSFLDHFYSVFRTCFPLKTKFIGLKRFLTPWLTASLIKSIRLKHLKHKQVKLGEIESLDFKLYCKLLDKVIKLSKQQYFASVFSKNKGNIKKTWSLINNIIGKKSGSRADINLNIDGVNIDKKVVPDEFNRYFTTVGQEFKSNIPLSSCHYSNFLSHPVNNSIFVSPTCPTEVHKIMKTLNCNKVGIHEPKGKIFKLASEDLSVPISKIFNNIISSGVYPDILKIACVSPIYMKDERTDIKNYRPISCLPLINTIIEKLLHKRFIDYLESNDILFPDQYGFRKNHSTSDAVLKLLDKIYDGYNRDQFLGTVMLDLSKAFDTVDHGILMSKLYNYGFRGTVYNLIKSYLTDRKQYVHCNKTTSDILSVKIGVPQGSVLGPLFFLIYVNDMMSAVVDSASIIQYADDTTLYCSKSNINDLCRCLSTNLSKIKMWLDSNYLSLNLTKTTFTVFTNKKISCVLEVKLNDNLVQYSSNPEFLGIVLDEKLTFNQHIGKVKSKVCKSIGILWKLKYLPQETLKTLYYILVYPYLLYCLLAWGSASSSTIDSLCSKQNKIIRIITKSHYLEPADPLFRKLNLVKLNDLQKIYCCIFMYKMFYEGKYGYFHEKINSLQINIPYNVRNNDLRLPFYRLSRCKQSIVYQGISAWNNIPTSIKEAKSVFSFKRNIKKYFNDRNI